MMNMKRRDVLKALAATSAFGVASGIGLRSALRGSAPLPSPAVPPPIVGAGSYDAFEILKHAVRSGQRITFGGSEALAAGADDMAVVTIKVLNHIHTPLVFALGQLANNNTTVAPLTGQAAANFTPWEQKVQGAATLSMMRARGLERPHPTARWGAKLRLNQWFAEMLQTGQNEANAYPSGLSAADFGAFPAEADVAVQAAVGVSQTDLSLNHSFQNCSLARTNDQNRGGDLGNHLLKQNIVTSPLGLVCFNMGIAVETTDAIGNVSNRVVRNDLVSVEAAGRSVGQYVTVLRQAVGLGYVDEDLVSRVSKLANADSPLISELKKNRAALQAALASLDAASALESLTPNTGVANGAALQAIGSSGDQAARGEFLGQCKFVQQALKIPGKPFRNFTLLLNIVDLDGSRVDTAPFISNPANPYSYVEGMRQLALGLNLLAQVIKEHKNVYVVVVAEGGRDAARGDNKSSFSMVMGPGGAGNLKDFLYANQAAIDSTSDPFISEPNTGNSSFDASGQRLPSGNVVFNEAGVAAPTEHMTNGALLNGLLRHLESKKGLAATTATGLGKFVRIQTA